MSQRPEASAALLRREERMALAIIHLNGNLGHDAERRYTAMGTPVLSFSVACSSYIGSGERRQEQVDWYRCALFGKRAEALASSLPKGTRVTIVGRLTHRQYTRPDGTPGCALDVTVLALDLSGPPRSPRAGTAGELMLESDEVAY
jgi:single-strand DNA-binding protein